jgi:hypothetical protein
MGKICLEQSELPLEPFSPAGPLSPVPKPRRRKTVLFGRSGPTDGSDHTEDEYEQERQRRLTRSASVF